MDSCRRDCLSPVLLKAWVRCLTVLVFISLVIPVFPTTFDSNNVFFVYEGFAASPRSSDALLILTDHSHFVFGRAMYPSPVQMKINDTLSSFSTTFVFSIVPPPSSPGGHGLAFIMTPFIFPMGAMPAQYLGIPNATSNGQPYNHLFAVEFDTVENPEFNDPDNNHVGVDINNLVSVQAKPAGYWNGDNFHGLSLKSGRNIQAWIDYDHLQSSLNVSITLVGLPRPQKPLISLKIDLQDLLLDDMFVGFSAATGVDINVEDHYILAWSFTTGGKAPPLNISHLPSFANKNYSTKRSKRSTRGFIAGVTVAALVVFLLAVVAVFLKRAKYGEKIEEWEQEFWPHRFPYKELSIATSGFREENILGQGGFGKVYKGVLPGSGQEVAVKCITKEFTEGMKGFVAEISTMGRMQHRNLVQLRGWCRRQKQLFIVYDHIPNGSLDKLIFGNPTAVLPWARRYVILRGVAAGLLYLHEGWEKRVIHRDIKSSNVLLDSELNGRLGDFGLARLYDHSKNPVTTRVMGTLGYIAPELTRTGKATPSSDVFSFGVLLLEVACGRKPVDLVAEQLFLVEWVWELYHQGPLLDAADPKLGNEYEAGEMEKVLKLGLLCSHPEPGMRLGIRHVHQILEGEAPLPYVDVASFNVNIIGVYTMGGYGYAANANPEDRILEELSSGRLSSTSLRSPR